MLPGDLACSSYVRFCLFFCGSVHVFTQQIQTILHARHAQGPRANAADWTGAINLHRRTEGSLLTATLSLQSQRGPLFRP